MYKIINMSSQEEVFNLVKENSTFTNKNTNTKLNNNSFKQIIHL